MALAETAELVADLRLKNDLSRPADDARKSLAGLDNAVEGSTQRVGVLGRVAARTSGSMEHFRGRVGGLVKGIGVLGLGGAAIALTGFLKSAAGEAQAFGDAVDRMNTLTRMGISNTSRFVDALGYFGISADKAQSITAMYLKNVDTLTKSKKDAAKFEKEYGFSLRDSTGHVKDAQEVITSFTDFFNNKSIPASQRAAAGAKIFGRSWQELLPIFQAGGREWRKQLAAGMELTKADIENLRKARQAQRDWTDALGDFKVMVGIHVLPVLSELASTAANWLNDPTNQKTLLGFLDQGIKLGKDLASFLANTVIPTVKDLAGGATAFWNALPKPLQDLLVTGLVADRTVKYLFGFSLAGVGGDIFSGLLDKGIGGLLGKLGLSRGSSPANPMYVAVSGGLGLGGGTGAQGGAGGVAATGGLASKLGRAVSILGAVTIAGTSIAALAEQFGIFQQTVQQSQEQLQAKADAAAHQDSQAALSNLKNLNAKLGGLQGLDRILGDTFGGKQEADALENLSHAVASGDKLTAGQITDAIATLQEAQRQALARGNQKVADSIGADIAKLQASGRRGAAQQKAAVDSLGRQLAPPLRGANAKLGQIAAQPTEVNVTTNVNTAISVRDQQTATRTASRYGFVAS